MHVGHGHLRCPYFLKLYIDITKASPKILYTILENTDIEDARGRAFLYFERAIKSAFLTHLRERS